MLKLLLTCEHGGNHVPDEYKDLFKDQEELLRSHQGYDIGALELFNELKDLADISFFSQTSRLLVELNRSLQHPRLFSEAAKELPESEKKLILKNHYYPYREQVEHLIQDFVSADRQVLHVSVHSFTPELNGEIRQADIGLLYDPKRKREQEFCKNWKAALQTRDKELTVRFNYPYLGISDGFTTYLRRKFNDRQYQGVELEVNQKYALNPDKEWEKVKQDLRETLLQTLEKQRTVHA